MKRYVHEHYPDMSLGIGTIYTAIKSMAEWFPKNERAWRRAFSTLEAAPE